MCWALLELFHTTFSHANMNPGGFHIPTIFFFDPFRQSLAAEGTNEPSAGGSVD
jgi:hypothetical protein